MKAMLMAAMMILCTAGIALGYGTVGFGSGGMGLIGEEGVSPLALSVTQGFDLGPVTIGTAGYALSWHSGYPSGQQELLLVGLTTVGLEIQDTRIDLGAGISDMTTDPRVGGTDRGYDPEAAGGLSWTVPVYAQIEASAVYLWSGLSPEPLFGGILFRWGF